jgi:hypothetical protein
MSADLPTDLYDYPGLYVVKTGFDAEGSIQPVRKGSLGFL